MAEEPDPEAAVAALRSAEEGSSAQRTSDQYRVSQDLPARFNHPGWFRGYRKQAGRECRTSFHVSPHAFSDRLIKFGMYRNYGINTVMEKSYVTGPDNFITFLDTLNFHPSYRTKGPSLSE
ncbi:UPF0691 protein C9orf116 homolog [Protobothrops mucrosquamatus]|uniref:UPF0691 protein C9orf116 homolog n=1 Tax=Protobothrops mucrosquamatus TaxID=103944 RepID=UPI0007759613|nr:UPF0691 protein C9orf116 homolog [Protobothrops mucrosquamatus]